MSETYVTVQGWVGSEPQFKEVGGRTPQASFRIGSTPRHFQPERGWSDRPTTWFNVECWRALAQNTFESVHVGQPVIVTGRLRTYEWTTDAGEQRSRVVLDALSVGHDLSRGTTTFTKSAPRTEAAWPDPNAATPADPMSPGPVAAQGAITPTAPAPLHQAAPDPDLVAPYPPDEFPAKPLPLTPTTREAEAA
ncbi:single-stranded DNA-binding protein [Kribbella sp. NPDC056951]|uniref:single-stranded DNA-binding protein n=1 Tax=Kribbella sp. NPDC056951 TaxID=3345978 RepID=UPI00363CC624